ncbi:MAG TPA: hypothetical protein VMY37_17025 [Thermoguttaceae bacterium]|nr:hypothetical protein [Thermoguttaceae bacterium]
MSNNSETVSKKAKRGRPKVFEPRELSIARMAAPDAKSERTIRNAAWAQIGLRLFLTGDSQPKNPQELGFDGSFIFDVKTDIFKKTILAELGRLCVDRGEDVALEVAKVICEKRIRARDAVARIRKLRGTTKGEHCGSLSGRLVKTINDYLAEHPEATLGHVRVAIASVSEQVEKSAEK